jgi:TolA-binding protein
VALLNLSGLGLGYAFMRRWLGFAICLIATGVLAVIALPAKPDGVSGGVLAAYLAFLVLAAAHGAWRGLRTRLSWPPLAPVAVVVGLVLLAVPAGGVVFYDHARDNATQKMLLDRLAAADGKVTAAKGKDFQSAEAQYKAALSSYRDLKDHHSGSKAAKLVPNRLQTFYSTVAAPYDQKQYCDAIPPLKYLRTVPGSYGKDGLGSLATWPDDRLATSLYECGVSDLESTDQSTSSGDEDDLGELLATFPQSTQAAKVEPAVGSTIDKAVKAVGGSDPCGATDKVSGLGSFAATLSGKATGSAAGALDKDSSRADSHVESGTYSCGVHQYKTGDFGTALTTMNGFTSKYPHDKNDALAKKFAIAAEIAKEDAAAGKHVPTMASGGSIKLIVSNDSPDPVQILYTGKVTGSFTLKACGSCHNYSSEASAAGSACQASGKHYPEKTVYLPTGTVYFLHKPSGDSGATAHADSETLHSGSYYTDCAYTVSSYTGF